MREIKFRAWDKKFNEWACIGLKVGEGIPPIAIKDYVFMQYTGLKDSKGKEIYEGDILFGREEGNGETTAWDDVYVAVFLNDKYGRWQVRTKDSNLARFCDDLYDFIEDYEVIGNIYENSDLLK